MNFGEAIKLLKQGKRVCRKGWNGKNMFIYLVNGNVIEAKDLRNEAFKHVASKKEAPYDEVSINAHIDMKAADGTIVVGWLASQTDMLAEDWEIAN